MYIVVVTYGNRPNQVFAGRPGFSFDMPSARKLRALAIEQGYSDARIENEKDFYQACSDRRHGQADTRWSTRKAS